MALRRHYPAYRQLDQLVMEGRAQLVGTPTADTGTVPVCVETQAGQVAIITKIVGMCLPSNDTSPGLSDAGATQALLLYDENGDVTSEGVRFLAFQRVDAAFFSPSAIENSWMSAVPSCPVVWEPEEPLIVPPRHKLRAAMDSANTMAGGTFACYGYIVDQGTARTLGFSTNTQDDTYKTASPTGITLNMSGFRGAAITSTGVVELVRAFPGYTVQVIDLFVRVQPMAGGATTKSVLIGGATDLTDASLTLDTIFVGVNNNHGDMAEWKGAPCIYLDPSDGLWIGTANDCRASVTCTYRYIPTSEVPQGQWRAYAAPAVPTGATGGTSSLYMQASRELTLKYPTRPDGTSFSPQSIITPDVGYQHVVEGYMISGQKDATISSDRLYFAIAEAAGVGSPVGLSGSGLTTTSNLISPILCLGSHNQMLALTVDGLNIPCTKDEGVVRVEMTATGSGATTPAAADFDVDELHVLVWGRTIPARFGTDHFQGAAS